MPEASLDRHRSNRSHRAGIRNAAELRQRGADPLDGRRGQRCERNAGALQRVRRDRCPTAAARHDDHILSERVIAGRHGEQLDRLDKGVVSLDLHDATLAEERRQHRVVAHQRAGVRAHHLLPRGRAAGLEHHDRLAARAGALRGVEQEPRLGQCLDDAGDDLDVGIVDEVADIVLDRRDDALPQDTT